MRIIIHGESWCLESQELDQLFLDFNSCKRFAFCRFEDNLSFNDTRNLAKSKFLDINTRYVDSACMLGDASYKSHLESIKLLQERKNKIEEKIKKIDKLLNSKKISEKKKSKLNKKKKHKLQKQLDQVNKKLKYPNVVFGGKEAWENYNNRKITKDEWLFNRNNQLFSRGDKSHSGNANLRIIKENDEYQLRVNIRVNIGDRKWIYQKLYIPKKYIEKIEFLLNNKIAYNVRLIRKDKEYYDIIIQYEVEDPKITTGKDLSNGIIGIDTNPDRIALAFVSNNGNLEKVKTLVDNKLMYASTNKRDYVIGNLAKDITNLAIENNKPIAFEDLDFEKDFDPCDSKKWNRIKSQFAWKKILEMLESKCIEKGIQYFKVKPNFTSIIGRLKYREKYKITIHESAAYVIGRRTMKYNEKLHPTGFIKSKNYKEKLSVYGCPSKSVKEFILGTLAVSSKCKRKSSWKMWHLLNSKATLTASQMNSGFKKSKPRKDLNELRANICGTSVNLVGEDFLNELQLGSEAMKLQDIGRDIAVN